MIILGIDPGLAIVGWGVIEYQGAKFRTIAYGSINTPKGTRTEERLRLIFEGMNELMKNTVPTRWRSKSFSSPTTSPRVFG